MDPEPAMLEEGRRRAQEARVPNLAFVLGGSGDLSRLARSLGRFAAVTMSQAFHWMPDQDRVLRDLGRLVDPGGAVAIVGYVNDPDYNRVWVDRPPWNLVWRTLRRHADLDAWPSPRGRHDPFPDILRRSPFCELELLTHEYETVARPSVDAAIGFHYTLSNVLPALGDRRAAFEAEVRAALADADTAPITVRLVDSALIGRRPNGRR